jgi:hypothetical protein
MRRLMPALAVLLAAPLAFAQAGGGGSPQMSYEAVTKAPIGSWAEYTTSMKGRTEQVKIRYSLVERNAKKMALEIDGQTPMGALLMRMEYEPAGEGAWKLSKAKMQMGGGAAQDMPIPPNTPLLKKGDELGEVVGKSAIKTAVGTFEAKQYKKTLPQGTFDLWMSDKVFPVGLVKQADAEGKLTTVLTGTGTGATSKMGAAAPAPAPSAKPEGDKKPAESKPAK